MPSKAFTKMKFLETFKKTAMIPFDSTGISIAFCFRHDVSNSVQIDVTWHFLSAAIFTSLYLCSLIYFFFCVANTFVEYSDTFFPFIQMIVGLCSSILQIIVRPKIITMIETFETVVEERK